MTKSGGCICRTNSQSWWNIHSQYKDYMPLQENAAGACSCEYIAGSILAVQDGGTFCRCPCPEGQVGYIENSQCHCKPCKDNYVLNEKGYCECKKDLCGGSGVSNPDNNCQCECQYWDTVKDHPSEDYSPLYSFIQYDPTSKQCICTATDADCPKGKVNFFRENYLGRAICDCRPCSSQTVTVNGETKNTSVFNESNHQCECNIQAADCKNIGEEYYLVTPHGGCYCTKCIAPKTRVSDSKCSCISSNAIQICKSQNKLFQESDCTCGNLCAWPNVPNEDGSKCVCASNASCPSPQELLKNKSDGSCSCACPEILNCPNGHLFDKDKCSCGGCLSSEKEDINGLCTPLYCSSVGGSKICYQDLNGTWRITG